MPKQIICPFCQKVGNRTDEHVWAQWMHESPAARALLRNTHGERIANTRRTMRRGPDGRFEVVEAAARFAKYLPHVKVSVCHNCNSGWMSNLENQAKSLLGPVLFRERPTVRLSTDELTSLAAWATKTWMAYSLTRSDQSNPFTIEDYEVFAGNPTPLARSRIWLLYSTEPRAQVGVGVISTLLTPGASSGDLENDRDNAAYAYLATSSVVFFLILAPERLPDPLKQMMVPGALATAGIRQIWPSRRPQYFPLSTVSDAVLAEILEFPAAMLEGVGLPSAGLTEIEVDRVKSEFLAGLSPAEIRRRWQH